MINEAPSSQASAIQEPSEEELHADNFVLKLLDLMEHRWINQDTLKTFVVESADAKDHLAFLRELILFIRELPIDLFSDLEQRQHWLTLCQNLMDDAIDQEEETLAEGE